MKNSLIGHVQKVLFKDPLLIAIIGLIVILPPVFLILMGLFSAPFTRLIQLIALDFSLINLIVFMFVSYEYVFKMNSCKLIECFNTTYKNTKSVVKNKIALLSIAAAIETVALIIVISAFAIHEGIFTASYFLNIFLSIILNIFLVSVAGISIGAFAALKMKKIPAYAMMIVLTFLSGRFLDNLLWIGVYDSTGFDVFKITGLFEISASMQNWDPNSALGSSVLPYRFAIVLLWISLFGLGIVLSLHQTNKRKLKSVVCILLAAACLAVYFIPSSKVIMDISNSQGSMADARFYRKYGDEIKIEESDFNITDLNMDISIAFQLNATAIIKVDNNLDNYKFTLYHGYKVKSVKINDANAEFNRQFDYLEIKNTGNTAIDTITISYSGYSSRYYSNMQGAILPGFLPFYPMAGFQKVFDPHYQAFMPNSTNEPIHFDVSVSSFNQFYSNIDETDKNHFEGSARSLTLVSGLYKTVTERGIKVIYPYLDKEAASEEMIKTQVKEFRGANVDNGVINTIIIVPSLNQLYFERVYCNDNYIIAKQQISNLAEDYVESLINADKLELYHLLNDFQSDYKYYQIIKEYYDCADLFEDNVQKYGEDVFLKECNKYLFDSEDNRSIDEFLNNMLEG